MGFSRSVRALARDVRDELLRDPRFAHVEQPWLADQIHQRLQRVRDRVGHLEPGCGKEARTEHGLRLTLALVDEIRTHVPPKSKRNVEIVFLSRRAIPAKLLVTTG